MGRYEILIGINWLPDPTAYEVWQVVAEMEPPGRLAVGHPDSRPWRRGADGQPFMERIAELLAAQGIAVARFEFPYMAQRREDGRKRPPNPQAQLLDCWRRVHAQVRETLDGPLALGGKSMGGRMASLLADELGADALVCLGYPFYAAGKRRSRESRTSPGCARRP